MNTWAGNPRLPIDKQHAAKRALLAREHPKPVPSRGSLRNRAGISEMDSFLTIDLPIRALAADRLGVTRIITN